MKSGRGVFWAEANAEGNNAQRVMIRTILDIVMTLLDRRVLPASSGTPCLLKNRRDILLNVLCFVFNFFKVQDILVKFSRTIQIVHGDRCVVQCYNVEIVLSENKVRKYERKNEKGSHAHVYIANIFFDCR